MQKTESAPKAIKRTDLKTRKMITDQSKSKARKYQELIIGQLSWWSLIKYELIMLLCNGMPGVLGLLLRSKLYPMILGSVGRGVVFGRNVTLRHPHKIHVGDGVVIDDNCMLDAKGVDNKGIFLGEGVFVGRNTILSCKDGDIILEDGVNVGFNCEIYSSSKVRVGKDTMLAAYCYLIGGGNYDLDDFDKSFAEQDGMSSAGIDIEESVWLAADVKVLDGVHIGTGTVVGAGAVVRTDIPAMSLAAGLPAKVLRTRQPAEKETAEAKPEVRSANTNDSVSASGVSVSKDADDPAGTEKKAAGLLSMTTIAGQTNTQPTQSETMQPMSINADALKSQTAAEEAPPAANKPAKTGRKRLFTLLKIAISVTLIYFLLRDTSVSEVLAAMQGANIPLLLLAFSLHLVGFTISAYRWRGLMRAQDMDASIPYLIQSYVVSMFFNNFLPSTIGGDAIRAYDSWRLGQKRTDSVAVVFVDRFLGLLVLMLFALIAVLFPSAITDSAPGLYLWVFVGTAGIILISWMMFVPSQLLPSILNKLPMPGKMREKLQAILRAFLAFQGKTGVLIRALMWSVLLQANVVLHYYLISEALGLGIPPISFFLIVPLATFVMMLPISINGIGVRESTFVFFFGAFAVSSAAAIAFSWIVYGMVVIQGLLGGIVYTLRRETAQKTTQ